MGHHAIFDIFSATFNVFQTYSGQFLGNFLRFPRRAKIWLKACQSLNIWLKTDQDLRFELRRAESKKWHVQSSDTVLI